MDSIQFSKNERVIGYHQYDDQCNVSGPVREFLYSVRFWLCLPVLDLALELVVFEASEAYPSSTIRLEKYISIIYYPVHFNFHAKKYYWFYFIPWLDFLHFHNPHVCWHSNKNFESKILWLLIVSHRLCKLLALQYF